MGALKPRRRRRSRAEWQAIVERLESAGISKSEFCRKEGISETSLAHWRRVLGAPLRSGTDFVEWMPPASRASQALLSSGEMELWLPGGVRLRFRT